MDLKILETVNRLLKKKEKKMEYVALVEKDRGAMSPSVKVYHTTLYKITYGEFMSKFVVEKFVEGGVIDDNQAKELINERLTEYFIENGI